MKKLLKRLAYGVLGLLALLLGFVAFMIYQGGQREAQTYDVELVDLTVPSDSASLAWGQYLTTIHGCQECHGDNLAGTVFADAPPFRMVAANLTSGTGGIGQAYTDADWLRALRHGVGPDGQGLWLMPSELYNHISNDEIAAMIGYLKTLPAVDNELPTSELKLLGRFIAGVSSDMASAYELIEHDSSPALSPPRDTTTTYGAYRASTMCSACHGLNLRGAAHPDPNGPYSPDLAAAGQWSFAEFKSAMQTGVTPAGVNLDPKWMPWRTMGQMDDLEMKAVYQYLETLAE